MSDSNLVLKESITRAEKFFVTFDAFKAAQTLIYARKCALEARMYGTNSELRHWSHRAGMLQVQIRRYGKWCLRQLGKSMLREKVSVVPPLHLSRAAGHHWLNVMDSDNHDFGLTVLQWNPGAKKWSHSGSVGTGFYVDTTYWEYVGPCFMPGDDNHEAFLKAFTEIDLRFRSGNSIPVEKSVVPISEWAGLRQTLVRLGLWK